jgi:hypothetical protein
MSRVRIPSPAPNRRSELREVPPSPGKQKEPSGPVSSARSRACKVLRANLTEAAYSETVNQLGDSALRHGPASWCRERLAVTQVHGTWISEEAADPWF